MKPVWKWSIGSVIGAMAIWLGVSYGPHAWASVVPVEKAEPAVLYSQTGRDRAFAEGVKSAKKSIYLRTASISCVPFANELLQAVQHGVGIHIEMPVPTSYDVRGVRDQQVMTVLVKQGVWFELGGKPAAAYEGSYMLIDDKVFYYSAGAMEYSEPGIPRSYVRGKKG